MITHYYTSREHASASGGALGGVVVVGHVRELDEREEFALKAADAPCPRHQGRSARLGANALFTRAAPLVVPHMFNDSAAYGLTESNNQLERLQL